MKKKQSVLSCPPPCGEQCNTMKGPAKKCTAEVRLVVVVVIMAFVGGCGRPSGEQGDMARESQSVPATMTAASLPCEIVPGFLRGQTISRAKEVKWAGGSARKIPEITRMVLSPNEEWLVWCDWEGNCFGWSIALRKLFLVVDATVTLVPREETVVDRMIVAMEFADPQTLLLLDGGGKVSSATLSADQGKAHPLRPLLEEKEPLWSGAIAGQTIILCVPIRKMMLTNETVLEKYDAGLGKRLATAKLYRMKRRYSHFVEAMAVSPDHKRLAVVSDSNAGIVPLEPFKLRQTIDVLSGRSIVWSPDGSLVAIGTKTDECVIADTGTGHIVRKLKARGSSQALAYSPQGDLWYASGGYLCRLDAGKEEPTEIPTWRSRIMPAAMVFVDHGRRFFLGTDAGEVIEFVSIR